jgi:hypothetical protein
VPGVQAKATAGVPSEKASGVLTSQLVIGAGQVGRALAVVLDSHLRDMEPDPALAPQYDVLHIAYPWGPAFIPDTRMYAAHYRAPLVIVHSTVPVGTCDPEGWVHSPVRGRHPDLAEGLETFTKHFGGQMCAEAEEVWADTLPKADTLLHSLAATTEAAKLWELATYGVEIAMQKRIHTWCGQEGLVFDEVYTEFGQTYNQGWADMDAPYLMKRLLRHEPGPIGGHCVTQNAPLLGVDWVRDMLLPHSPGGVWE